MKLNSLISSLEEYSLLRRKDSPAEDLKVRGIACDSRKVLRGYLFVAIKGTRADGMDFIKEAISRGARAVITESIKPNRPPQKKIAWIRVKDARLSLAVLAAAFYGYPSRKMRMVGVTGTNGKTTVTYLIESLLREADKACAVIGTVNYRFKGRVVPSINTTPGPIELNAFLAKAYRQGIPYAAMEVSSHALTQCRVAAIDFSCAVFTNLTQDHLDYHSTMEHYFQAKLGFFKGIPVHGRAIINNDDKYAARVRRATRAEIISYGITSAADVTAKKIRFDLEGVSFLLSGRYGTFGLRSSLIGRHNLYNILAACAWALSEGLGIDTVRSAVAKFRAPPGRLERVMNDRGFYVFVDYAHTEDALKNVILALRDLAKGRLIVVFGCGGERDRKKRPKMGAVVTRLADFAVLTSDNPRSEDPLGIIRDIRKGIKKKNFCILPDRRLAIAKALSLAGRQDTVLIAGKGHEHYQILKDRQIHFDDREVAGECLR